MGCSWWNRVFVDFETHIVKPIFYQDLENYYLHKYHYCFVVKNLVMKFFLSPRLRFYMLLKALPLVFSTHLLWWNLIFKVFSRIILTYSLDLVSFLMWGEFFHMSFIIFINWFAFECRSRILNSQLWQLTQSHICSSDWIFLHFVQFLSFLWDFSKPFF